VGEDVLEFGLGLLGYHGCWDDVAFAERHGFATAGFVDSPLLGGETFACMALAAAATQRIRLGPFLAVPGNRSSAVTAQGVATINRLAPGRTFLALGTGYTSRNTFGLPPVAARRLRDFALACRGLLDGEAVEHSEGERSRLVEFAQPGGDGDYIALAPRIPVYIAGDGPKALSAAGEAGDGWVTTLQRGDVMGGAPELFTELFTQSRAAVRAAALAAGRELPADLYTMWSNTICVLEPGESAISERVLARVGAYAMMPFHSWADDPRIGEFLPPAVAERLELYEREVLARFPGGAADRHRYTHRGHLSHLQPGEEGVLTEEIVRMTTLTGSAEEIAERLHALAAAGLRNLSIWAPPPLTREVVAEVHEQLMPLLRGP
jgi:alkanesulfonate monooxygenase SsuD/methylene tetrahydromethanopterin reductase-like flavin-dependent oxidoreductase (luciferase family)